MSAEDVRLLLSELERRWAPYGGRDGMRLRAGLDDATMDALVAPIGYTLDEEQRAWWSWADGTAESNNSWYGQGMVVPGIALLPLSIAVEEYQHWVPIGRRVPGVFPEHWLPLTPGETPIVSAATGTSRTQVATFDPEDGTDPNLESIAHMLDVWLHVWDRGDVRPIPQSPGWAGPSDDLPNELLTSGVLGPV